MKLQKIFILIFTFNLLGVKFKNPIDALKIIKKYLPSNAIILEAGAYDGTDTINIYKLFPYSKIHAFEPIPYLYNKLVAKTKFKKNIFTYKYALGESDNIAVMYVSEVINQPGIPSQSSSLLLPKDHLQYAPDVKFNTKIVVPVITIDSWAKKNRINHVDFMWLDLQGFALNVLKASPNILKTVKVILVEVEFVEAYQTQSLFKDVENWLSLNGFKLVADNFGVSENWFGDALFIRK